MIDVAYPYYGTYMPNFYPGSYQQTPPPVQQTTQQYQTPLTNQNGIIWVPNEQAANDYLVAPNSAVTLWDSNAPVVYLKQADASGKPSMKIYDLVERTQRPVQPPKTPAIEYAPLSRLEALEARLNELTAVKESSKAAKRTTTKEDAE